MIFPGVGTRSIFSTGNMIFILIHNLSFFPFRNPWLPSPQSHHLLCPLSSYQGQAVNILAGGPYLDIRQIASGPRLPRCFVSSHETCYVHKLMHQSILSWTFNLNIYIKNIEYKLKKAFDNPQFLNHKNLDYTFSKKRQRLEKTLNQCYLRYSKGFGMSFFFLNSKFSVLVRLGI